MFQDRQDRIQDYSEFWGHLVIITVLIFMATEDIEKWLMVLQNDKVKQKQLPTRNLSCVDINKL